MNWLRLILICLTVLLAIPAALAAGADEQQLIPIDGSPLVASLKEIRPGSKLVFAVDQQRRVVAAPDLVRWGSFADAVAGPQIVLANGLIVAQEVRIADDRIEITSRTFDRITLPIAQVKGILLRAPLEPLERDQQITAIARAKGESDRLRLENGDELSGTVVRLDDDKLALEGAQGQIEIDRANVRSAIFNPALGANAERRGLSLLVGFKDGSRLLTDSLTGNAASVSLKVSDKATLTAPLSSIVAIQTIGGRATYLSDLRPASYKHVPYLQTAWPYRADQNVQGGLLRASKHVYPKGLGMHSAARLTYDVPDGYRRFEALLAIDDQAETRGSVVVSLLLDDGTGTWKKRYSSPIIRGGEAPRTVAVDLKGAKRLSLLVDFADWADEWDHVDWLDARLVR